jgi:hypothetical protein
VEGAYWESLDRVVYSNGTIMYRGTGVTEQAIVIFGTVGGGGAIAPLPHIQANRIKGIVSRDWKGLQMVSFDRFEV